MQIRQLTEQDIPDLLKAINGSFADYIVPFQLNAEQLQFKMQSETIVPEWSIGVFEDKKMIAFIMHGVRTIDGKTVVYNAGTGVLPDYRGQGLVGKMYNYLVLPVGRLFLSGSFSFCFYCFSEFTVLFPIPVVQSV